MDGLLREAAAGVQRALKEASVGLVERTALVEAVALAAVAGEHVLVIGAPGTAKSQAVRRAAASLGGRYFEYLLGRFTEPSELFGPVDLRKLQDGVLETATEGMLPEAEMAFLDEVFQGSTAILNTLLGILHERAFQRGRTRVSCPLRVCVGASNALPDDPSLAAFADRFLIRQFVEPVADPLLEDLLEGGWSLQAAQPDTAASSLKVLDSLAVAARGMDLGPVRPLLAACVRALRAAGIHLSDRRVVKLQQLLAAAAALDGRGQPGVEDLWTVVLAVPTAAEQAQARDVMGPWLREARSASLPAAAEDASRGPAARGERLRQQAETLLALRPTSPQEEVAWRQRLEGVARELDAGFAPEALSGPLRKTRADLVAALAAEAAPQAVSNAPAAGDA